MAQRGMSGEDLLLRRFHLGGDDVIPYDCGGSKLTVISWRRISWARSYFDIAWLIECVLI
jgi:hypothetical protein